MTRDFAQRFIDQLQKGVSILELADDKIFAFRTYYDSAAFVKTRAADTSQ